MSYNQDGDGRYGHLPPVQYPVNNGGIDPNGLARQPSFSNGDDQAGVHYNGYHQQRQLPQSDPSNAELFLPAASAAVTSARGSINSGRYGGYNPQAYRNEATSLPYHPAPTSQYGNSPTSPYGAAPPHQHSVQQQTYAPPAAYNPAAYANTNTSPVNRSASYNGNNTYTGSHTHTSSYSQSQASQYSPSTGMGSTGYSPITAQSSFNYGGQSPYDPSAVHSRTHSHGANSVSSLNSASVLAPGANISANAAPSYGHIYDSYAQPAQYPHSAVTTSPGSGFYNQTSPQYNPRSREGSQVGSFIDNYYGTASSVRTGRSGSHASQAMSNDFSTYSPPRLARHPSNAPLPMIPKEDGMDDAPAGWSPISDSANQIEHQDNLMREIDDMTRSTHVSGASQFSGNGNPFGVPPQATEEDIDELGYRMMLQDAADERNKKFSGNTIQGGLPEEQESEPSYATEPVYQSFYGHETSRHPSLGYGDNGGMGGLDDPNGGLVAPSEGPAPDDPDDDDVGEYDIPEIFFHPGFGNHKRALPIIPVLPGTQLNLDADGGISRTPSFNGPSSDLSTNQVERASSVVHPHQPTIAPARSSTHAGEVRKPGRSSFPAAPPVEPAADYDTMPNLDLTLPSARKRKLLAGKISTADIRRCHEPWSMTCLATWIKSMVEGEEYLKPKTVEEAFTKLFTSWVPMMNIADAEALTTIVMERLLKDEVFVQNEEWISFGPGTMSTGVLYQLSGRGCYAPKVHTAPISAGRCYSHHCTRTLRKANLDDILSSDAKKPLDWDEMYKITPEMIEAKGKAEAKRQRIVHEVISSEQVYMNQLEVLRVLYRDQLRQTNPPIIPPNRLEKFVDQVFGKVEDVSRCNKDHLLAQLKYRQQEQGPWIASLSDLFREWIRKARSAYLAYAAAYPMAELLVRREEQKNMLFKEFLNDVQKHKRSERLGWTTFLKSPITRLQRYSLLLETVVKESSDGEEKSNLEKAIKEIREVTLECDAKVAEVQKEVTMKELAAMIVLRQTINSKLNLDHLGRELLLQGDLLRAGSKNMSWVNTHALLFDHYLVLAKVQKVQEVVKYDVSKEPIPMPLLVLESDNEDPIFKKSTIGRPSGPAPSTARANTNLSAGDPAGDDKVLYPFKIKHLGHEVFTLHAPSAQSRLDWCNKITEAKTRHAKALHSQDAEPFRLRVLADSAFSYNDLTAASRVPGVPIRETPLDRAIRDLESVYGKGRRPAPVCRAMVNCATGFMINGRSVIAIGTDAGVFVSETTNPRGWTKTVTTPKVTQIAILEQFSICLLISDRSLISYPLDVVAPMGPGFVIPSGSDNPKKAPHKLAKDVSFFAAADMKDRTLVFYKRKEGVHSNTFKVLEPVYHKSNERRGGLMGKLRSGHGSTELFRDYDEFYLPVECYSLNLFQSYIAVATAKGFELLTLDKKQPVSIPDLKQPNITNIANRMRDQKPLGMFRLNEQEFLLAYEDCAVYVDKHGDVSRTLIMEYSGRQKKARAATLCGQYLLLFNEDYVEVRNAENGRLRQIIAGKDVRCLDFGNRGVTVAGTGGTGSAVSQVDSKTTVKIAMTHPEIAGMQIVLEMVLQKPGHLDK